MRAVAGQSRVQPVATARTRRQYRWREWTSGDGSEDDEGDDDDSGSEISFEDLEGAIIEGALDALSGGGSEDDGEDEGSGSGVAPIGYVPVMNDAGEIEEQPEFIDKSPLDTWGNPNTLDCHFDDHGADFNVTSREEYAQKANDFLQSVREDNLPTLIDRNGVIRSYDPESNTFGSYNPDYTTRSFFKPDDGPEHFARETIRIVNGGGRLIDGEDISFPIPTEEPIIP